MELCDYIDNKEKRDIIIYIRGGLVLNIRSKNLKIRNLPKNNKRLDQVNSKPYLFLIIFFTLGVSLLLCKSYLIGTVVTVLFLYNICFVRNSILIEFFEEYVVFYNTTQKDECFLLFWEDIAKWQYKNTKVDFDILEITLKDGKQVSIKCIGKRKTLRYLKRKAFSQQITQKDSRKLL